MIKIVIQNFQPLNGWQFQEISFLYGLSIVSHGLSIVFFIQTWRMDWFVTNGQFDMYLIRPLNVFFQFSFQYFNFIGFTDIIPGIIILLYAINLTGVTISIINILKILLVIIGATFLRGAIYTIIGSMAFWIKRSNKLIEINLLIDEQIMRYPLTIYPRAIQFLLTFILPFGFIGFYPASEILGVKSGFVFPGSSCLWTLGIGIVSFLLSIMLFYKGLSKYESSGS